MLDTKPKTIARHDGGEAEAEHLLNSLLEAGDFDGARDEFERLALEGLDSDEPAVLTRRVGSVL